jgi:8-oxo-dGTP pyrophosphatase MutT (NUDIX family)
MSPEKSNLESAETIPHDIWTTRVIVLSPTPGHGGGFSLMGIHKVGKNKDLDQNKLPGGKTDALNNPQKQGQYFEKDEAGKTLNTKIGGSVITPEGRDLTRESALQELEEELGLELTEEDLIPLAKTGKPLRENKDRKLYTMTYVVFVPHNATKSVNTGFDDYCDHAYSLPFITSEKNKKKYEYLENASPKYFGDLGPIAKQNYLINRAKGDQKSPTVEEILRHHYVDEPSYQKVLSRLSIITETPKCNDRINQVLEDSTDLNYFIEQGKKLQIISEDPDRAIYTNEYQTHSIGRNGRAITLIDLAYQFPDLTTENKETLIEQQFTHSSIDEAYNPEDFFRKESIRNELIALAQDLEYDISDDMITGITSLKNFERIMQSEAGEDQEKQGLLLAFYFTAKRLYENQIIPENIEEKFQNFEPIINQVFQDVAGHSGFKPFKIGQKSYQRILKKGPRKGDDIYVPKDILRGKFTCPDEKSYETARAIADKIQESSTNNFTDIDIETEDGKEIPVGNSERYGEVKIMGKFQGLGFEIQINDAPGFHQSEDQSATDHAMLEIRQDLTLKYRLMLLSDQRIRKASLENDIRQEIRKNPKLIGSNSSTEEAIQEIIESFLEYGFFSEETGFFIDYKQCFSQRRLLKKTELGQTQRQELVQLFNSKINHLQENSLELSENEWESLFNAPLLFFRNLKKEEG